MSYQLVVYLRHKKYKLVRKLPVFALMFCLLSLPTLSPAQQDGNWEYGAFGGYAGYYGDLNPIFSFRRLGGGFGAFARKNFDGRLCLRLGLSYANVGASDAHSPNEYEQARNLSFSSDVIEGSVLVEFNFQDFHGFGREQKPISPYLMAGFGLFHFTPKTRLDGVTHRLQPLGTEGQARGDEYNQIVPAIIMGGGIKFDINPSWSWNIEVGTRSTFTDYLDDVSGTYADARLVAGYHGELAARLADRSSEVGDAIGAPGRQRGDSKGRDHYLMITVGFAYRLNSIVCPAY